MEKLLSGAKANAVHCECISYYRGAYRVAPFRTIKFGTLSRLRSLRSEQEYQAHRLV